MLAKEVCPMKILGASVLIAESMTMGFAILLAMRDASNAAIIYGCVVSFLLFVAAGLVRRPGGFVIGSLMQVAMIGFGFVEPSFFIICLLYTSPSPRDRTRSRMPSSA